MTDNEHLHSFYKSDKYGNNILFMHVHGICNSNNNHKYVNIYGTDTDGNAYNIKDCHFVYINDEYGNTQLNLHISNNEILTSNKW